MSDEALPEIAPEVLSGVPFCSDNCPQHDGKRCRLLGVRPGNICEPGVDRIIADRNRLQNHVPGISATLDELKAENARLREELQRVRQSRDEALGIISRYGGIDGDHHKQWVLDQAVRAMVGDGYAEWLRVQKDGEDGPNTYDWSEGIPP